MQLPVRAARYLVNTLTRRWRSTREQAAAVVRTIRFSGSSRCEKAGQRGNTRRRYRRRFLRNQKRGSSWQRGRIAHSLNPTRLDIHGCPLLNLDPLPVRLAESAPSHAIIQLCTKRRPQDGELLHSSNRFRVPEVRSILLPHTTSAKCRFIATIPNS